MPRRGLAPLALALAVVLAACGQPAPTPEPILLRAAGSTSMRSLAHELAAAYGRLSPTVTFEVDTGGTGFGLRALAEHRVEVCLASWLPETLDGGLRATAIARDAIAIIVHPSNGLDGLGLIGLQELFSGRVDEWWQAAGQEPGTLVQPVSREEGSGTRASFEEMAMGGVAVTPRAVLAPSSEAAVQYVADHPEAIAYVSMGAIGPEVKVLALEGQEPSPRNARVGSYPLTRELWLVYSDPAPEAVQEFVSFVLSPAGQNIVERSFGRIR